MDLPPSRTRLPSVLETIAALPAGIAVLGVKAALDNRARCAASCVTGRLDGAEEVERRDIAEPLPKSAE
jgi:hypothetical protein